MRQRYLITSDAGFSLAVNWSRAMVERSERIATVLGTDLEIGHSLAPRITRAFMSAVFRRFEHLPRVHARVGESVEG